MIRKGGMALKPFLPQIQTTFIKCLQDYASNVRSTSALALGKLSALNTRVDPLVGDLLTTLQASEHGIWEAVLNALKGVLKHAGKSVSNPTKTRVVILLKDLIHVDADQIRTCAAGVLGMMSQSLEDSEPNDLLQMLADSMSSSTWFVRHDSVLTLSSMLRHDPAMIYLSSVLSLIIELLKVASKDDKALGRLLLHQGKDETIYASVQGELFPVLVSALQDDSAEVRRRALSSLKAIAKENPSAIIPYISNFGPALAAERCALHVFQLTKGPENVQAAQKFLTGLDARRLSKLPENSDGIDDSDGDSTLD